MQKLFEVAGRVALEGQKAVERGLNSIEEEARNSQGGLQKLGDTFDRVGGKVTSLGGTMTKWVTGPLAAATAGVGLLVKRGTRLTQDLERQSQLANTSVEDFQKQAFAVETAGIEQDKYADILKDVNDKLGDFSANQAGPVKDFFENIAPQVGVTAEQFERLSGPEALQLYVNSLEEAGVSQQRMTFYMEALGNDASALLPLLRNNGQEMKRLGDQAEEAGLIIGKETVDSVNSAQGSMAQFGKAIDVITVQLADAFLPVIKELIPFMTKTLVPAAKSAASAIKGLVEAFTSLPGWVQKTITTAVGLAAALGPVLVVVGKIISVVGSLIKGLALLKGAFVALGAVLGTISAPAWAIIAVIVAVGAAIVGLIKWVQNIVAELGGWGEAMKLLKEKILSAWEAIKTGFTQAATAVAQTVQKIIQTIRNMPAAILAVIKTMVNNVVNFFTSMGTRAVQAVKDMVMGVVNWVKDMASSVINSVQSMFNSVVGNSIVPDMAKGVAKEFAGMTDNAIKDTDRLVDGVNDSLKNLSDGAAPNVDVQGGASGGRKGKGGPGQQGGTTVVDMRHSVIRDDKDMLNRMRRGGLDMTGAF